MILRTELSVAHTCEYICIYTQIRFYKKFCSRFLLAFKPLSKKASQNSLKILGNDSFDNIVEPTHRKLCHDHFYCMKQIMKNTQNLV